MPFYDSRASQILIFGIKRVICYLKFSLVEVVVKIYSVVKAGINIDRSKGNSGVEMCHQNQHTTALNAIR